MNLIHVPPEGHVDLCGEVRVFLEDPPLVPVLHSVCEALAAENKGAQVPQRT